MAAPKGNEYYRLATDIGRKKKFTPESLRNKCNAYFKWVEEHPLIENKPFAYQGVVKDHVVNKMRIMTIEGLCIYLGIVTSTWEDYAKQEDFSGICEAVKEIVREQKVAGASADLLNAGIVTRLLGLADSQNINHSGNINSANLNINVDENTPPDEAARIYQDLVRSGKGDA